MKKRLVSVMLIIAFFGLFFSMIPSAYAYDPLDEENPYKHPTVTKPVDTNRAQFCDQSSKIWYIAGEVFLVIKILVPLLIIILGSVDLAKAMLSNDDKQISKSSMALLKRSVVGVIIFLLPTVIKFGFSLVSKFNKEIEPYYGNCLNCLVNPNNKKKCIVNEPSNIYKFED